MKPTAVLPSTPSTVVIIELRSQKANGSIWKSAV